MVGFVPDYAITIFGKKRICYRRKAEFLDWWISYTGICCTKLTTENSLITLLNYYISIR